MKNITDILQASGLSKIASRANLLNELNRIIPPLLPEGYSGLYRITNLVDNQLVLEVRNASVKQGFLLQQTALLARIQPHYPQVTALEIRVSPYV